MKVKNPLKGGKKLAGLDRRLWVVLLIGAIVVGLYLRRRRAAADAATSGSNATDQTSADALAGQSDAGLAGAGVISPPGGVYPVTTPVTSELPTGIVDTLTGQQQTIADLAAGYNPPNGVNDGAQQAPPINITLPTGGGPPNRPKTNVRTQTPKQRYTAIAKRHPGTKGAAIRRRAKKRLGV